MPTGLVVGIAFYFALSVFAVVVLAVVTAAGDRFDLFEEYLDTPDLETTNVWFLGISLVLVAFMLPSIMFGRFVGGPRPGDLWSVQGRLRWRWLGVCSLLAAVVYAAVIVGSLLIDGVGDITVDGDAVLAIVVVLATVPLQATAEEAVFRGQIMQMVATWTRFAIIPVVLSTVLFVSGHTYDWWGLTDVGIFGLTAAYLAIRTGGLEASIAAHAANNIVLMCAEAVGAFSTSVESDYGPIDLLPTVVASALMIAGVEVGMRVMGIERTRERLDDPPTRAQRKAMRRIPPPPVPIAPWPPPPPGAWPPPGSSLPSPPPREPNP